jgi:quercetin 2,3-dioxygenase
MTKDPILRIVPLGFPWETMDPFLFCVHHDDRYPAGNEVMGPAASLEGRALGQDFEGKDGWRMYHGQRVPGFPAHPHRGFETVTVVRTGLIDHADSLGAAARYGGGDVQWLTAGQGIVHAEMFPLVHQDRPNPLELFQIWLNLPSADKMAPAHFSMFWRDAVPVQVASDQAGRRTQVTIVAGALGDHRPPAPPPRSWAAQAQNDVAIWTIKMEPGARWTLPATAATTNRMLYAFAGTGVRIAGRDVTTGQGVQLQADAQVELESGLQPTELLLLQGRPIGERVVQYGPFVMNSPAQIQQAFNDYQHTHFGNWTWPDEAPVHARDEARFARHADGRVERAPG